MKKLTPDRRSTLVGSRQGLLMVLPLAILVGCFGSNPNTGADSNGAGGTAALGTGRTAPGTGGATVESGGGAMTLGTGGGTTAATGGSTGTGGSTAAGTGGSTAAGTGGSTAGDGGGAGGLGCRLPTEQDLRIAQPKSPSEELWNAVLPSHLDRLYRAVGRFASGEAQVLRGTVDILEHRSVIVGQEDEAIDSTSALASLAYDGEFAVGSPTGVVLMVFDPAASKMVSMLQVGRDGPEVAVWRARRHSIDNGR